MQNDTSRNGSATPERIYESKAASDALVNLEVVAINVMSGKFQDANGDFTAPSKADKQMAIDLLHSERYHKEEMIVMKPIDEFYQNLEQRTKSQVNHLMADINRTSYYEFFTFTTLITAVGSLLMAIRIHSKSIGKRFSASNTELKNALDDVKPLKGLSRYVHTAIIFEMMPGRGIEWKHIYLGTRMRSLATEYVLNAPQKRV